MTNFTKGPWSLPHFARPNVDCQCGFVLTKEHFGAVATVHCSGEGTDIFANGDNPKFEQAVANAHLIAAAPELYEALQAMLEFPNAGPSHDMARAALAKAEGGGK